MAYLGDLSGELSKWQRGAQGTPTPPTAGANGTYLGDLSGELAAHKKGKKVETPRAEPTVTMSPAEQAKAKQLGYDTAPGGPAPAYEDVAGRVVNKVTGMVEHPIQSLEGFAQSLPLAAGATEGYRVAKEGMTQDEINQSLHQYERYALRHGASPEDAKIIAKARFNKEMVGHPWAQAVEGGLQRETQNDIGLATGAAVGAATGGLGAPLAGGLGAGSFQAANEYQTGGFQKDPREAAANIITTGGIGAGLGALMPGHGGEAKPGGPGGPPAAPNTIEALAAEGRAPAPGQPPVGETPAPRGGPGEPPVTPATPPENRVLDKPAVKIKRTGKVITGRPGENHDQILARAKLTDKQVVRGFRTDEGKWRSRAQARQEIAAKTGVDVGPGSPTSEQLQAEQGLRPPGQGAPAKAAPTVNGPMVAQVINTVDPSAPAEQHLVTPEGLKKLQAQHKDNPYVRVQVRPADPRDIAAARGAGTGTQQVPAAAAPGQPGNRIGPGMVPPKAAPAAPAAPIRPNDFSREAILKRAENFDFGKGAPKGAAAEGRGAGPKVTISARDTRTGRFLKRKVAASKVTEHVAGLRQEGFPEVAVSMPGFSDRAIQNRALPNFPDEPVEESGLPAEELGNVDISALPQMKPPGAAPARAVTPTVEPYTEQVPENAEDFNLTPEKFRAIAEDTSRPRAERKTALRLAKSLEKQIQERRGNEPVEATTALPKVVDMTPTGGQTLGSAGGGMEMAPPTRRPGAKAAQAASMTPSQRVAALELKAADLKARGDQGGASTYTDAANKARMQLMASEATRKARQAAAGPPTDPFEMIQAAHDAEARGDKMGAQELRNKAALAMAARKAGAPAPQQAIPGSAVPPPAPAVPEEAQIASDLEKAVQPAPVAPEPTQTSVPAEAKAGTPAVYDEYAKKIYTPANGKTYEYVRNLVKRNPLKYQEGHLGPGGRFVEGPQKPVEPALEAPKEARVQQDLAAAKRDAEFRAKFRAKLEAEPGPEKGSLDYLAQELERQNAQAKKLERERGETGKAERDRERALRQDQELIDYGAKEAQKGPATKADYIPYELLQVINSVRRGAMDPEMAGRVAHSKLNMGPYDALSSKGIADLFDSATRPATTTASGKPNAFHTEPFDPGVMIQEWDRAAGHEPNMLDTFKTKAGELLRAKPRGSVVMPEAVVRAGLQVRNLGKAIATNFGGSFEDIAERGKHIIRAASGEGNKLIAQVSHAFDQMRPALETLSHDDRLDWMERADKGLPQATPELQQLADAWHGLNKRMLAQAEALARRLRVAPSKLMPAFKEWYFPRVFKNAADGEAAFSMWQNRRPLGGSKEYFKQRSYPTLADAIEENRSKGRELLSDNPVDILQHTYSEFQKFASALDVLGQMSDARDAEGRPTMRQFVERGKGAPQGWVPEPTEFSRLKLGGAPKGKPGQWYVPEPLGHVLNNHLSPGLWRQGWYRTLRYGTNDMNLLQLGFSGFHVMMTGLNSAASDLGLAMGKLARGQFTEAAGHALRSVTPGPSMIGFWREGYSAEKAFLNGDLGGQLHPMMQAFFDAGGKLHTDREYINGHVAAFRDAVRSGRGMGIRNILRAPLAAAELSGRPLFETLIPRVKLGVFMEQAAHELKDLDPQLDRAEYLKKASGILDSVDNRFGMINYDNLFWNKTYQNLIHIFTRAPGWYLGTFREYGGAFRDLVREKGMDRASRRMQFALASLATTALWSTLYQYASTGTTPHIDPKDPWTSWRNVMHPLSGRKLADGTPERVQWPSYIKDLEEIQYSLMNPAGSPKDYLASKESPLVGLIASLGSNADWKNQMIRNPADPRLKQWYDTLKFIGKDNLLPISVQNAMRRNELQSAGLASTGANQQPLIETALGITVPKRRWLETPFRNALYEDRLRHLPRGPYTPEEIKQRALRNEFASIARRTHDPDQLQQLAEKYYERGLSINEIKAAAKMGTEDPLTQSLKGASLQAILSNYSKASPEEQRETILAIGSKFAKAGSSVGPKQYGKYRDQFMHIMMEYEKLHRTDPAAVAKAEEESD